MSARLRSGKVFASVVRNQNLKDLEAFGGSLKNLKELKDLNDIKDKKKDGRARCLPMLGEIKS